MGKDGKVGEKGVFLNQMLGFTKKRFIITAVLSLVIWVSTNFIQLLDSNYWPNGFSLFGSSCTVTGYPIAQCLSNYELPKILAIYGLNILFWFWVIHLFWGWFDKRRS